jgi:hypothetical protein
MVALFAQLFALGAARDLWLPNLPRCWQSCFANTGDGCSSSECESRAPLRWHLAHCTDNYQVSARRRRTAVRIFVAPSLAPCRDAMPTTDRWTWPLDPSSCCAPPPVHAYAAAADGDDTGSQSTTTTRTQKTSTARTATAESTFSTTSSTLSTRATSTEAPPRPITEPSLPSLMLLPTATLAAGSQRTGNSAGGGGSRGSPFDAPSSSNRSRAPGALLVLGALAILCLRV